MDAELVKRENRLSKYLDLMNPDIAVKPSLGKKESELLELMKLAYHWRCTFKSPDTVRKMLMEEGAGRSYSSACQIYSDMEFIYGRTAEIDKNALRRIMIENYYSLLGDIDTLKMEDWDKVKRKESILEKIAKLAGLGESDVFLPDMVMPPRNINIVATGPVQIAQVIPNEEKG